METKEPTVEQLVDRCLAGDQSAVVLLINRYQAMVFGLCFRMLGHRQDAEDVVQESFVRAVRALNRWDRNRDFKPWLLAIAGNRCRTHLSKRGRRAQPAELVEDLPDQSPDAQAARNLAEEVQLALREVREEYRRAFLLYHEEELSYAEIAEALDCPVGTVKTWVHRARRQLIERLRRRGVVHEVRHEA
ncbi:MAG: RNA polymerase sigma factor [Planctomycetales bacterium]